MYSYNDPQTGINTGISIGTVVDTNDPQQMGRVRVRVEAYGDTKFGDDSNLPWAAMCSPFAGMVHQDTFTRGPDDQGSAGPTAYGMFNAPKVGATALVTCIDGDLMTRVVVGYMHVEQTVHSMPHGRFLDDQQNGPINSQETQINPLYNNQTKAFVDRSSFEWKTRGADRSVGSLTKTFKGNNPDDAFASSTPDDPTNGYQKSRLDPSKLDPQVYCWVTPGFHAISMDDSTDNCRIRVRTTTGHQIILDDTNERIYISTNEGENWVEMDSDGSIDVFSTQKVSIHANGDINLRSNQSIRLDADDGVHIKSATVVNIAADTDINIKSAAATNHTAESYHVSGGSDIVMTAGVIHLNGPAARSAEDAYVASRIPDHEPWGRTSTASDTDRSPRVEYDSDDNGRENKQRNPKWRR